MAEKKFLPSLHPRDRFGRFTRSRSAKATPAELKSAATVEASFKRKRGVGGARSKGYLDTIATDQHRKTVDGYIGGGYVDTHKALRAGDLDHPGVKAMDAAMVELPDDIVLSRRVPLPVFGDVDLQSLVGLRVRDAAYSPTGIGTVRATKSSVRMRITVPAGTKAAVNPDTGEVILDRDLDMVVTRVEKNSLGTDMHVVVLSKQHANDAKVAAPAKAAPVKKAAPKSVPAKTAAPKPELKKPEPKTDPVKAPTPKPAVAKPAKVPASKVEPVKAPASKTTPKDELSPSAKVEAGDFSGLKKISGQAGSNPGGLYEAADGSRWYVKSQESEKHASNEALASALYRQAGVDVPNVVTGSNAPGLTGQHQTASKIVDGAASDLQTKLNNPAYKAKIRSGFAVDAWLANWDTTGQGFDNIVTGSDGKPWRIDLGGALLFRAQGAPKGNAFGDTVAEWTSLRDGKTAPNASRVFAGATRAELVTAIGRLNEVTPGQIRSLAAKYGLPELADQLIARRADLVSKLPGLKKDADRHAEWVKLQAKALSGQKALDSARLRLTTSDEVLAPAPAGWSSAKVGAAGDALDSYHHSGYGAINKHMRGGGGSEKTQAEVAAISDALAKSPLSKDVLVYRGIFKPASVFGAAWNDVDVVGLEWDDKAFASTSADLRIASQFGGSKGSVIMRIVQRKGTGAVRLSDMAAANATPTGVSEEAELLFGPQRRRVVADHGVDASGRRILDVEVVS